MLLRTSKSRLPPSLRRKLLISYNELQLPWLCPAFNSQVYEVRRRAFHTSDPQVKTLGILRSEPLRPITKKHKLGHRGVASTSLYEPAAEDFIPFETSSGGEGLARNPFYQIPLQRDTSRGAENSDHPLILHEPFPTISSQFRSIKGISTGLSDIHQTLYACLQVGRLDRAATLLKRLNGIYKPDAPGLLIAHNAYLRELVSRISYDHDEALLKHVQKWFAVQIKGIGIKGDASTFASMIHASLFEPNGKKRKRTVTRYVALAAEAGVRDETILTASEGCSEEDMELLNQLASPNTDDHGRQDNALAVPEAVLSTLSGNVAKEIPEVLPAQLKGLGLTTLQKSLSLLDEYDSNKSKLSAEDAARLRLQTQHALERSTLEYAMERWREEDLENKKLGINSALAGASLGSLMWSWHEELVPRIREEIRKANAAEDKQVRGSADTDRCLYGPYLQYIPPEKLSAAVILSTMTIMTRREKREINKQAIKVATLADLVGEMVLEESIVQNQHDQEQKRAAARSKGKSSKVKKTSQQLLRKLARYGRPPSDLQWSIETKVRVGVALLAHLFEVAKLKIASKNKDAEGEIIEEQPAFLHAFTFVEGRKTGIIRFHSALLNKLGKEPLGSLLAKNLPMLVEPKPWTAFRSGGFLEQAQAVVRLRSHNHQPRRYIEAAVQNGDLKQVFKGLDVLGRTGWAINRSVFEVMVEAWNDGKAIAKIPAQQPVVEYPPEPSESDSGRARALWLAEVRRLENHRMGLNTQRCYQNFQVEIARAYLGKTFYLPHNVDFRGRAYPLTPFFNQMCADNVRGLLLFAKGKELGQKGLRWLKIHLANVFGFDKASLSEREQFAMDHLSDIHDSVTRPLNGDRWWLKAEDPWQCLATCMELHNALNSGDPSKFVSHLPIHQDGTCNGLQHYAALGGDPVGAKEVNLEPSDRPADIYTAVADSVRADIEKDAAQGLELAQVLKSKITRKVVKQTVMTNVYGVTFIGAKLQVQKQLEDLYDDLTHQGTLSYAIAAYYIAGKIFKALSAMFTGAHDIQFWFGDCSNRICQSLAPLQIEKLKKASHGGTVISPYKNRPIRKPKDDPRMAFRTPVIWTSPLKLPVVQPYRKLPTHTIRTNLQRISLTAPTHMDPVHRKRQLTAFAPNFIHSLDATHMVLTATKCDEIGLTFSAVHDSFWTHASDVDTMNIVIREAFIKLHSEDIIGRLAAEFSTRYKNHMYLAPVKSASAVGQKLKAFRAENPIAPSVETGKKTGRAYNDRKRSIQHNQQVELLQEVQRLELLASDNVEDRKKGEAMITPGKIFAQMANEEDIPTAEDLGQKGLGHVPAEKETTKAIAPTEEDDDDDMEDYRDAAADQQPIGPDIENLIFGRSRRRTRRYPKIDWVWQPLTFPPVPKKVCYVHFSSS